ncbi:MAG: AmpG family muropeptide MFS transporter [Bacteriovoracia bacterium]
MPRSIYIKVFTSWRMAVALLMGFMCGLPLALTASGSAFQAWMKGNNVDLKVIGIFSLVGLPYSLKFIWAPLLDRYTPKFLGRRRGWILISQIGLILSLAIVTHLNPTSQVTMVGLVAMLIAFFGASQDIVVDAYRAESFPTEQLGAATSVYVMGYRIAMLVSGAVAMMLADHFSWQTVYFIMCCFLILGLVVTYFSPDPQYKMPPPKNLQEAVVLPFLDFFKRKGAAEILVFAVIYKLDAVMTMSLTTPFLLELGFTKTDIGAVSKVFGMIASITGTLAGGALMIRLGVKRSLWLFGIVQGFATLSYWILSRVGYSYPFMVNAIVVENFCSGLANACFLAFLMGVCNKRFTATQYALLSSLTTVTRAVVGAPTGYIVEGLGWSGFYIVCMLTALPGLLLLLRYDHWDVTAKS